MAANDLIPEPLERMLRIFVLDPSLAAQYGTARIGEITIGVRWERDLLPGPIGEYIEVVDADPASGYFYQPVDLNDLRIVAQDGLAPSETNPQFHQQMVYAVAMATIAHFEQALGRVALWSAHRENDAQGKFRSEQFVRRLRIYPHALRERNAYYSPDKKALLFGYFAAGIDDENNTRDSLIFTALSHDIIAHETTHALLDGVHPRFNEPINEDVLAFHEAFADIVALFQHFSYPGVLRHQIAQTRGDLSGENLLAQLAQQFGKAAGRGGALRDALGEVKDGRWQATKPDVRSLDKAREPHARGAILVAAVFGAFLKVYRARTLDLYRIATEGTGVLRAGDIHSDLLNRLADEAASCAQYILQMCIRAIDYCPPVGITFGGYLRAVVTGDYELYPDDPYNYRLAMVESFRQWGIYPRGMRSMSVEALLWPTGEQAMEDTATAMAPEDIHSLFFDEQRFDHRSTRLRPWNLESDRYKTWEGADDNAKVLWHWLMDKGHGLLPALGLVVDEASPPTVFRSRYTRRPSVEVHSVRTALRRSPRGSTATDLVVEITQRRRGYFVEEKQREKDAASTEPADDGDFRYRAGCTVLIDPVTMRVRRIIRSPGTVDDDRQLARLRHFLTVGGIEPDTTFWLTRDALQAEEPFALLHRHHDDR
jgi:hypothetical protein